MIDLFTLYEYYLQYPKVVIDSRQAKAGTLFFALKGERSDGNAYAQAALDAGAAYAIIDNPHYQQGDRFLLVDNVLKCLQDLAAHHRSQFSIPVIAITGSNGKTTTKELVSSVLVSHYPTHFTAGNFNNHIGLPLTLLAMEEETEVAVIEMGANHQGEIAALCEIAQPTHGVITNIGKAHLEGFGGLDGVKAGKSELYMYLATHKGVAFINLDAAFLKDLSQKVSRRIFYLSSDNPQPEHAPYEMKLLKTEPFLEVAYLSGKGGLEHIKTQLIGAYNYQNVMTAVAIGRYFKVPDSQMVAAIEAYRPANNRSQVLTRQSNTFILDAYNANPTSMGHALESFASKDAIHKVAILGDMLELGEHSEIEHRQIIEKARGIVGKHLILVGEKFAQAAKGQEVQCFSDTSALKNWFDQQVFQDTLFIIKGSRGIHLEELLTEY